MWGDRMPIQVVVLASALCLLISTQTQGQGAIPPPVNLSIESRDFHTVLKWEVADGNLTNFNVSYREYEYDVWKSVCSNILTHYCDLSNVFVAQITSGYYTKVQAFTASQKSQIVLTNRFTFGQNATLSPPTVLLAANGNNLIVEVKYPALNSISSNVPFNLLSYNVCCLYGHGQVCKKYRSQKLHFQVLEGEVCVFAEVHALKFDLKGNKSEQACLEIHSSNLSVPAVVIPTVLIFVIMVISISALIYFLKCKKKLALPKSLAHIIVNEKVYHVINPKSEESSECVLIKSEEMTKDTEIDLNHELQEEVTYSSDNVGCHTINADESNSKLVNADSTDLYAAKMNINGIDLKCVGQDDIEGGISDQDSSRDSCPTHLDSMKQNFTPANWGYDKPQIPLNMV
ncbi:interleukin-22 receptor subunit alpha-2-like isoform X2 [Amblyraja radiata]|uniref:interleukin-22 receptor subunit alpha-2-like isoform X2 n=1 Tax=Amblyraja radiata TaxID=386614 RepID=UPI0014023909|nr:interleukin-22 receptor subunit alpha-2-like isoform X2 [Amblyraja radiata]